MAQRKTQHVTGERTSTGRRTPLSAQCKRLLALVRQQCPDLLPSDPLRAGSVGPDVVLKQTDVAPLVQAAADPDRRGSVVWTRDDSELLVHVVKVQARITEGLVVVSIPVYCEETQDVRIEVPFAVGDDKSPAGLFAATELRPRGPATITVPWGDALTTFAWKVWLSVCTGIADNAGRDEDGAGLIPSAISTNRDTLTVMTQARHAFDRVTR